MEKEKDLETALVFFHRPDNEPLPWSDYGIPGRIQEIPKGKKEIDTFTIIVRPAVGMIKDIHDWMPAILPEEMWNEWMDPFSINWIEMKEQLMFGNPGPLDYYPVSKRINSSRNEGEELILREVGR